MNISMNVVCRKDKMYKNNTAPIHIRFTQNRKIRYVSTKLSVHIDDWDFENQRIKEDATGSSELQYRIDSKVIEYKKRIHKLEALEIQITFDNLLESTNRKINCTVKNCFNREIERLESLGKYTSASKHKVTLSLLEQFKTANIRMEDVDLIYLNDFELFLRQRGNKDNSIATKFAVFKALYNKAALEELFVSKSNPFKKFKVGRLWTETRKRAISKDELERIIKLELPESTISYLVFARDIFLFTYFTAGINIGDIARLEYRNISNGRLQYVRSKTGKEINCKLMPMAIQILEKYSKPFHSETDYIFPILDKMVHLTDLQKYNRIHKVTQKVNKQLKELAKLAKISTHITTYVARHAFCTQLKLNGVSTSIISQMLAHSSEKVTQIYLDSFGNEQIDEAMKNLL